MLHIQSENEKGLSYSLRVNQFADLTKEVGTQNGKKWQATKLLHVALDIYEEQIRAGRYFLHNIPWEHHHGRTPRATAQQRGTMFTLGHHQCVVSKRRSKQRTVREMSTSLCRSQQSG